MAAVTPAEAAGPFGGKIAGALGAAIAQHFAKYLPVPQADTPTDPRGGRFCDVMTGLRWPPAITTTDKLNPSLSRAVLGVLEHGAQFCGWSSN